MLGISAEPVRLLHNLSADDEFLILASDGVWSVMKNDQAVAIVRDSLVHDNDLVVAARELVNMVRIAVRTR